MEDFGTTFDSPEKLSINFSLDDEQLFLNNQELIDDIEKLKIDYENSKTEIELLQLSNNELKKKICDLFQDAQSNLIDKQKCENLYKDLKCKIVIVEKSSNWYKKKFHESEALNQSLRIDIETYEKILSQREKIIKDLTVKSYKYDELKLNYQKLELKCKNDDEEFVKIGDNNSQSKSLIIDETKKVEDSGETKEEYTRKINDLESQLELLEQRYSNSESSRNLSESSLADCRKIIKNLHENVEKNEIKNVELLEKLKLIQADCDFLSCDNKKLNLMLLSARREQVQVEECIVNLRLQLTKLIAQYKSLKSRNTEAEKKLLDLPKILEELDKLKNQNNAIKNSYQRRIKEEKIKSKLTEKLLSQERDKKIAYYQDEKMLNSMRMSLYESLEREKKLKEHLKYLSKGVDESIDEGYADGTGCFDINIPSPAPIDPSIIKLATELINKSQNFMKPLQPSIDELRIKIEKFGNCKCLKSI